MNQEIPESFGQRNINIFLNHIHCQGSRLFSSGEMRDIRKGVDRIALSVALLIGQISPLLKIDLLNVSETSNPEEGEYISVPYSFKYQLQLEYLSRPGFIGVSKVCPHKPAYVHVKLIENKLKHQYYHMTETDWSSDTSQRSPHDVFLRCDMLWKLFSTTAEKAAWELGNETVTLATGTLTIQQTIFIPQASSFTVVCEWQSRFAPLTLRIFVDLYPVVRFNGPVYQVMDPYRGFYPFYYHHAQNCQFVMLLPCKSNQSCKSGLCFGIEFTQIERLLIVSLSQHHKRCYYILSYLLYIYFGDLTAHRLGYILKVLVLNHQYKHICTEKTLYTKCVITVLDHMEKILSRKEVLRSLFESCQDVYHSEMIDAGLVAKLQQLLSMFDKDSDLWKGQYKLHAEPARTLYDIMINNEQTQNSVHDQCYNLVSTSR